MTLLHQAAQKAVEALTSIADFDQWNWSDRETVRQMKVIARAALESAALQQQPEPVARSAHMCGMQGFDGMLDICPACEARRAPPALQHQEVPREPAKLWLWMNFMDGRPEYWAFDNPYPRHMDCGDPQTLGEPCGYALFKPSRDGSGGRTEEQVLQTIARLHASERQLMTFYGVETLGELVEAQARHIEKLQAKLPPTPSMAPQRVRKG